MNEEKPALTRARIAMTIVGLIIAIPGVGLALMGGLDLLGATSLSFHQGSVATLIFGFLMACAGAYTIFWAWASYPKTQ